MSIIENSHQVKTFFPSPRATLASVLTVCAQWSDIVLSWRATTTRWGHLLSPSRHFSQLPSQPWPRATSPGGTERGRQSPRPGTPLRCSVIEKWRFFSKRCITRWGKPPEQTTDRCPCPPSSRRPSTQTPRTAGPGVQTACCSSTVATREGAGRDAPTVKIKRGELLQLRSDLNVKICPHYLYLHHNKHQKEKGQK